MRGESHIRANAAKILQPEELYRIEDVLVNFRDYGSDSDCHDTDTTSMKIANDVLGYGPRRLKGIVLRSR